jgi:hypothetical protein
VELGFKFELGIALLRHGVNDAHGEGAGEGFLEA